MARGQVPMPLFEAAVGVLLLAGLALVVASGVPATDTSEPQLDAYAADVGHLLANEPPRHENQTRLAEVAASPAAFERERAALERRVDRLLPANLFYQIRTPHGRMGHPRPSEVTVGRRTVTTVNGPVTVLVWYG